MSILQDFQQKKPEIFRGIMHYLLHATSTPEERAALTEEVLHMTQESTAQFIRGYLDVLEQTMEGNHTTRDEYLGLVVPPLKQAGLSLPMMGRAVAPMFAVVAAHLGPTHLEWLTQYSHEYSERFYTLWESL